MYDSKIKRSWYIDRLASWRDKDVIKVVTGIRRCGKTTLFELFRQKLVNEGISEENIIAINFEDPDFSSFPDWRSVWNYLKPRIAPEGKTYIFLDEIQNILDFEKLVDGLYSRKNIDVYITGSNAKFLSGELATFLTGRYVEIRLQPLHFTEYASLFPGKGPHDIFNDFLRFHRKRCVVLPDNFKQLIAELRLFLFAIIAFDSGKAVSNQLGQMQSQSERTFLRIKLIFGDSIIFFKARQTLFQSMIYHAFINSMHQLKISHFESPACPECTQASTSAILNFQNLPMRCPGRFFFSRYTYMVSRRTPRYSAISLMESHLSSIKSSFFIAIFLKRPNFHSFGNNVTTYRLG